MKLAVGIVLAILAAGVGLAQEQQLLGFADHLFGRGDYYRAITEYERFSYLYPTNPLACRARYSVAMCYCRGGKFDAAIPVLQSVKDDCRGRDEAADAALAMAEIHYRMGNYASAVSTLDESAKDLDGGGRSGRRFVLLGLCDLRMGDNVGAVEDARKVPPESGQRRAAEALERAVANCPGDEKSPALAGALSAVLPGAGQLYVGRRRDALTSFIINGLFIAGIVSAFRNDEQVAGAALSIVEVGWYSGNIYGAVNGAHKRNAAAKHRFFGEVEFQLNILSDWSLPGPSVKPAVGIGVRF